MTKPKTPDSPNSNVVWLIDIARFQRNEASGAPMMITFFDTASHLPISSEVSLAPAGSIAALVVVDDVSGALIEHPLFNGAPNGRELKNLLESFFEKHGTPSAIRTDNSPLFASAEVVQLLSARGIRHEPCGPDKPGAMRKAERIIRGLRNRE